MELLAKLIFFLPLLGATFVGLQTRFMNYRVAQLITSGLLVVAAVCSFIMFKDVALDGHKYSIHVLDWIYSGDFQVDWAIKIDTLTSVMLVVVTSVSALVHIYSIGYMAEDPHKQRFMSYLSLFTFFMLVLVTGDNFIQLFVGWEGVGLCSYLLIGFWFNKNSANAAAMKAFIVNRVGDFGLVLGIAGIYLVFGTVNYDAVFAEAANKTWVTWKVLGFELNAITTICILLFIGAMGKSAQFGLHTWLPDAMEGPTPVSALIHAATMVTAGVFLLARCSYLFELSDAALTLVTFVGAVTAIFAATIAITQNDIKKVIAYSTCSQLGYMVFSCGLSAYSAGIFHLATHAFFKALLFLGAGSVIHAMHHEQDMQKMGGLWKKIPFTFAMMAIGSLAIIGAPYLAGYYSKEAILGVAYNSDSRLADFAFYIGVLTALLTAFYSARLFVLTFLGHPRDHHAYDHAHESPLIMTIPLFLLSIGAVAAGYYGEEILHVLSSDLHFWNGAIFIDAKNNVLSHIHHIPHWIPWAAMGAAAFGMFFYWFNHGKYAEEAAEIVSPLYKLSYNKWYVDEIYDFLIVTPYRKIADIFWKVIDAKIIDGMPNGAASVSTKIAKGLSKFQSGYISQYAFVMVAATAALITIYIYLR